MSMKNLFKGILIVGMTLILLFAFTGCNLQQQLQNITKQNTTQLNKLKEGEYLVAFSKTFTPGVRLVVFNREGEIVEEGYLNDARAIRTGDYFGGKYIFTSERSSHHFMIDQTGQITPLYLLPEKYGKDNGFGTILVDTSDDWLIYGMNIGNFGEGNIQELIYQKGINGEQKNIQFKGILFEGVSVVNQKICINYSDEKDMVNKGGIYIIDPKTNEKVADIPIEDKELTRLDNPMKPYKNKLLIAGYYDSTTDDKSPIEEHYSTLAILDIDQKKIKKMELPQDFYPAEIEIYNEQIYLIDEIGRIYVFDENYNRIKEFRLSDAKQVFEGKYYNKLPQDKASYIRKTILKGIELYVFYKYTYSSEEIERIAAVHVYDIRNGNLLRKTEISLKGAKKWWGDYSPIVLISQ